MDLRQLRYFQAIAETGSISAASHRLNVAQPSLSLHLRNMEEHLGTKLLLRGARGVQLTEAGEMREDLNLPGEDSTDPELANKIQAAFDTADDNDLEVLVIVTKCKANKADADPIEKVTAFKTQPME